MGSPCDIFRVKIYRLFGFCGFLQESKEFVTAMFIIQLNKAFYWPLN